MKSRFIYSFVFFTSILFLGTFGRVKATTCTVTSPDCDGQWGNCAGTCDGASCPGNWAVCVEGNCMVLCSSPTCSASFCSGGGGGCTDPLPTCTGVSVNPSTITNLGSQNVTVTATGVQYATNWVRAAVWTEVNGQDDIVWYDLGNLGGGTYSSVISMSPHSGLGTIYIHVYMDNCKDGNQFCGGTSVTRTNADAPRAYITAPSPIVFHYGNMNPTANVTATATDSGNNLININLPYKECTVPACDTGTWLPLNGLNPGFVFPATGGATRSYTWAPPSSSIGKRYNLVVNAEDSLTNACSGNPIITTAVGIPWGSRPWYNCDDTPANGTTDSVFVEVKAAPTATMAASSLVVAPGSVVSFTPTAHDLEGNLNRMAVYRRLCTDASCTTVGAWSLASSVGCDFTFPATTSRTLSGCSWTSGVGDIGTWQVMVNAFDNNSPVIPCTGNPDHVYPWSGWYDCGNADLVTLTVRNTSQISGKVVEVDGSCPANLSDLVTRPILNPLHLNTRVRWYETAGIFRDSGNLAPSGTYTIDSGTVNPVRLLLIGLMDSPTRPDMSLIPMCAYNPDGTTFSGSGVNFVPNTNPYNVIDKKEVYLAYDWDNLVDGGWTTLLDGDIYSNDASVVAETVPTSPLDGYLGYLMQRTNAPGSEYPFYAFSEQNIDVQTPSGDDRVATDIDSDGDDDGGWVSSVSGEFGIDGYEPQVPGSPQTVTSLTNLPNNKTVVMNATTFNTLLSSGTVSYSVTGSAGETAVVHITGDINISGYLRPLTLGDRLVLVVDGDVNISPNVGALAPLIGSSDIEAFILASGDINILSTGDDSTEVTLTVKGSLVSTGGSVNMNRNLGDRNIQYPALVVDYDPGYIYTLTNQERLSSGTQYPGLFVADVEWEEEQ